MERERKGVFSPCLLFDGQGELENAHGQKVRQICSCISTGNSVLLSVCPIDYCLSFVHQLSMSQSIHLCHDVTSFTCMDIFKLVNSCFSTGDCACSSKRYISIIGLGQHQYTYLGTHHFLSRLVFSSFATLSFHPSVLPSVSPYICHMFSI